MKNIAITALLFLTISTTQSQVTNGKFMKLFDEFLLENYESCLNKSLKLTEKDDTKNEPEPYLYVSMCYLRILEDPALLEIYPNALKEAQKYAAKAIKKDEKHRDPKSDNPAEQDEIGFYKENNVEFFENLKRASMDEADFYFNEDNFSKAASGYSKILKFDPEDENILMITAACYFLSRNLGQGKITLEEALKQIKTKYANSDYQGSEVSMVALERGIIAYGNYLIDSGDNEAAKSFLNEVYPFFKTNTAIRSFYTKVTQ